MQTPQDTVPTADRYRAYLVNHLSAARCADSELLQVNACLGPADSRAADVEAAGCGEFLNQKLVAAPLQPLREMDATPSRVEERPPGCAAARTRVPAVMGALPRPGVQSGGRSLPGNQRKGGAEWRNKLADFLAEMAR
jgi:hypothetical protein